MNPLLKTFFYRMLESARDLMPVVLVVGFFQIFILKAPIPDFSNILVGALCVLVGLTLFIAGLEMGLFPIGESMAFSFAQKGSLFWLLMFGFFLGFSTTIAEPALTSVAGKAAEIATQAKLLEATPQAQSNYALGLRLTVAISVGLSIVIGILRILKGWPIHYLIVCGYLAVVLMAFAAPTEIIGIAFDSGGVTTSTITVPLITALGIGLATVIRGRNPMIDGFGLVAFASLLPILFVMGYGVFLFGMKG